MSIESSVDCTKTENAFAGTRGNTSPGASIGTTSRAAADADAAAIEAAAASAPRTRVAGRGEENARLICGSGSTSESAPETAAVNTASENRCKLTVLRR